RLAPAVAVERPRRGAATPRRARRRPTLRSPVVALAGVIAVLTGAGVAAAADWLQIFRTERVAPVSVTEADLVQLPDLSAYGDVEVMDEVDVRPVADAAEAARQSGLPVPEVRELPRGVTGQPTFRVGSRVRAVFTFSAEKAARAAEAAGETLPPPPPGLDGSRFRLVAGPGLAAVWPEARGLPALLVARAVAPTADSSGVPFATARDYLLSLPGLPDDLASQLRDFSGDGTTLPLPLPAGRVTTSAADVGGVPATVFGSRDGTMAGVVWVVDGNVCAVAGSMSTDEVLSVARGLRWRR
ncbi:MAG TPA: hypothetical protein VN213_07830, partial [Solirubrobacteraceae bacterium]|nr:hypothetical protein [Solirubrobacteraceae bacterium]